MILLWLFGIISGLIFILLIRWFFRRNIWKEKGIAYIEPYPYVGNMMENILKRKSLAEIVTEIGSRFKNDPLIGFYNFTKPVLLINDPEYAELVLVKEFSSFMNRGEELKLEERRPLDKHLFFICGSDWKAVRSKITPVFTTGKLKGMLPEIERIFHRTFADIDSTRMIDLKDIIEKFTLRVRASCVFGLDLSKFESETEFTQRVENMSKVTVSKFIQTAIALWFPKTAKRFNFSIFGTENENYFIQILLKSFKERAESNIVKHDFIQTLLELKNTGKVEVSHWTKDDDFLLSEEKHPLTETIEITDDLLVAQSFIFLVAGLEPLISTLTMLLIELSRNQSIAVKLREEIDNVIKKHQEFSYQALKDMEYLELCIKETLRLHTPAEINVRHCCREFTFPNGVTIEKGTALFIPGMKFHSDAAIFSDPTEFKPERFLDETYLSCSYIPFGQGPRICIGMRFAMMEMKMFISKLVYNYSFTLDSRTTLPVKTDKWFFLRKLTTPVYLNFDSRTHQM